ncbi:hypothetical protein [Brevibacillus massiliensis]|uniref:hypothetical protein n=1 Tax=Brevibacillus massiliensis TaxID=1118054 RepID=UPI0002ED9A31|nr:hypothetical protein [Brevibacillus massiliensis]
MSSLDLLERKLLKIFAEAQKLNMKHRQYQKRRYPQLVDREMTDEEKREMLALFIRRIETLPAEKQQEVLELLRLYDIHMKSND